MAHAPVISVLFAFDHKYAQHGAACIASLLRQTCCPLEIVIASVEDPEQFAPQLRQSFQGCDRLTMTFLHFKVPEETWFPTPYTLTKDAYLRLWAHEFFPGRSRILYLDPDTIVSGPIEPLWNMDLEGKAVAAVPIPNSARPAQHGMPPGSLFFNSGVLLMDLDAWRERDYCGRCLDFINRHPERAIDADQDILNLCLIGDWMPLDYVWNVINPFYRPSYDMGLSPQAISRVRSEAKIIHYNGGAKPWVYLDNHPRQKDYLAALKQTAWRTWRPDDRTVLNICRKHAMPFTPRWVRNGVKLSVKLATRAMAHGHRVHGVPGSA